MKYPIYITRRGPARLGGTLPDFPDAVVEGGSFDELQAVAGRQVMACYHGRVRLIPPPTTDMAILQGLALDTGGGIWRFIDLDLTGMTSSSVRIELCLPACVVLDIDRMARARHMTRDAIVAMACQHVAGPSAPRGEGRPVTAGSGATCEST
ncbi:type II toxin-antitoxin system HicB family antitoxin [Burkholderia sp. FERM BP-3421]|jgi:HicB_like antitoxin of bacterial toxin-antitoxin system|uniref:type II toxin-antitoxin system HicB family antitoxin n=1 Tax=Burkholderia sp. FERM BP-3421 TaxID=1494466 RepID=UPI00235E39AE|nr:type II toxin-antitoxin system HicB family antitoxin [Burkholderia sp. FERM BP-3421]WDD90905.1 type II toxin-antitoxin system HicB family antitoxin [Burkholderia sp. FERM BP-3421]